MIAVKMASVTRGASQSHHSSGDHEKDGGPPAAERRVSWRPGAPRPSRCVARAWRRRRGIPRNDTPWTIYAGGASWGMNGSHARRLPRALQRRWRAATRGRPEGSLSVGKEPVEGEGRPRAAWY